MQINLYSTRLADGLRPELIKEKEITYHTDQIHTPETAAGLFKEAFHLNEMAEEYCYMLAANTKGRISGIFLISKGTVRQSPIGIREVFLMALLAGAASIILCHNHPSGDCSPSRDDILLTEKLIESGKLLGIPLTDHIIVGGDSFYSFREHEGTVKL